MYRFTINTDGVILTGKYGIIPAVEIIKYLLSSWDYFLHRKREGVNIKVSKDQTKITLLIDQCYCVICNDLLMLQRRYPQCLKMSKEATKWLDNYKSLFSGKR